MEDELLDVVDEHDNIIGEALKSECHRKGLHHRNSVVLVLNSKGEMLVQTRASDKSIFPDCLCSSAAGHVGKGDTYEEAARRELKEELGIECGLKFIGKFFEESSYNGLMNREHYGLFVCVYDGEFHIQKSELSAVRFYPVKEIKKMIKKDKDQFTPGFRDVFSHYLDYLENKS